MDVNELLFQAAVQTIDALSFTQSHVVDSDFRAHSKATIDSVRSLQREQRNRIEQMYGPRVASSDALAAQLGAAYRGETASLDLARDADNHDAPVAVTSTMTQSQCQAFKKELKQRIHEWERAFREERGAAVTAHDKASLRHIYELYKAAKNRLRGSESPPNGGVDGNGKDAEGTHLHQQRQQPSINGESTHGDKSAASVLQPPSVSTTQLDAPSGGVFTLPASMVSSESVPRQSVGTLLSKGPAVGQMPNEELAAEKRYLKRILHHFESEFEQHNGHVPTKQDRRAFTREYTRYGELKNEIQRRSSSTNQKSTTTVTGELLGASVASAPAATSDLLGEGT
ncbi:hypothetical protein DQ04_06701010 [Trypanosoma grayi]|uniref:hypothetical protein n=1 Tax=Trypanosoma grayi TaxID=71804 RepID=UPI0004F489EA|nr:hypothetical protein DQ04_06701010 [Trypanosoma grayi]KEG08656.1 hypothetical protein DQ04_06701010 [Trypanosoma grayi]